MYANDLAGEEREVIEAEAGGDQEPVDAYK